MADVAEAEATGDFRGYVAAGSGGDLAGDVKDGDRRTGGDVVGAVAARNLSDDCLQAQNVGPSDVSHVDEVAHLGAVLEDLGRLATLQ